MHVTFFYVKKKKILEMILAIFYLNFFFNVALQLDLATLYSKKPVDVKFLSFGNSSIRRPKGWSVGSGKNAAKVFKNGQESPGDNTINEPVLRPIRMLVCFCAQSEVSIYRASFLIS